MNITRKEALEYLDDEDVRRGLCRELRRAVETDTGCRGLLCSDCGLNNREVYVDFITKLVEEHFE